MQLQPACNKVLLCGNILLAVRAREDVNALCVKLLKSGQGDRNHGRFSNRESLKRFTAMKGELRNPTANIH